MPNTDFSDYAKYLEEAAPEIVAEFNEGYVDPTYVGGVCQRCYVLVPADGQQNHSDYHRSLTLTMYAMGSTLHSVVNLVRPNEETEEPRPTFNDFVCKRCGVKDTPLEKHSWFKCCPTHTPQNSAAIMCEKCAIELHGEEEPKPPPERESKPEPERRKE